MAIKGIKFSLLRFILFLVLLNNVVQAEGHDPKKYSLRLGYGISEVTNLSDILQGNWQCYKEKTSLINLDAGYKFWPSVYNWPIDIYVKGALTYFNEEGVTHYISGEQSDDFLELTLYFKVYWNIDFLDNRLRVGFGEGLSFAKEVPIVEVYDAIHEDELGPTSKILNYLDISFDLDIGQLLSVETLQDTYLGYTIKHRSGIFGLFNGVKGGSNYNMMIERNF